MTGMDDRLREKRERGRKRVEAYNRSNKTSSARKKGEEALDRIERLEMIIAYIDTQNLPKHVEKEVSNIRDEVEERTDYEMLFKQEFRNKLGKKLCKEVDYIKKNGEKVYTVRENKIYNYYSTNKPSFEDIIDNYDLIEVETNMDVFVERIRDSKETDYKDLYLKIQDRDSEE